MGPKTPSQARSLGGQGNYKHDRETRGMARMGRIERSIVAVFMLVTAGSAIGGGAPPTTIRVASELANPVFATHAPGDLQRIFIVEQAGRIKILRNGQLLASAFLNVDPISSFFQEEGLLGLAFHPDYASNGKFFIYYIDNLGDIVVARYTVSADPDIADTNAEIVLRIDHPPDTRTHHGGWISFGPYGYLYIAVGDGGGFNVLPENAQDITENLMGKVLRINVDADDFPADANRNYAIPPDNPFVGIEGDDEIWAYGLRNPWRCAFDSDSGDLYIADVGHSAWEEINYESAGSPGGNNYGWKCMEGMHCTTYGGCTCPSDDLTPPIHEYDSSPLSPRSITGGEVYRACAIPELVGTYFYADYYSNEIWSFRYSGGVTDLQNRTAAFAPSAPLSIRTISSFGKDAAGELYICDHGGGELFKIIPGDPIAITSADPPAGAIDARRPFNPDDSVPVGWQEILMTFDGSVNCLTPLDFTLTQQGGASAVPFVTDVQSVDANEVHLFLNRPLPVLAWTTIRHFSSGSSVQIGFLPADVDGDAASGPSDIDALIDTLVDGAPARPIWSTDIDRSGRTTAADLMEAIDLLIGAGKYDPFDGASLP